MMLKGKKGIIFGVANEHSLAWHIAEQAVAQGAEKAPFRVLFSNDTTNLVSNVSPFHQRGEPFRPEVLEASVDETADDG